MPRTITHWTTATVALATFSLALTGCSPTDQSTAPVAIGSDDPIMIDHAYGTLELDSSPERVVTLGLLENDVAVSLGVTPIAIGKFFATESGIAPWLLPELDETPVVIDTTTIGANGAELDVEAIAALKPDVIIATTYSQLGTYYDQLSEVAPVLGPSKTNYLDLPWRDQTRSIAEALGMSEEVEAVISATETELADSVKEHPETTDHDYTISLATPDQLKVMNEPTDASAEVLNAFGLTLSKTAEKLPGLDDGSGSASLSEENVASVDADVVMVGYFGADAQDFWEDSTLFQELEAVKDGGYIAMDLSDSTALRNPSPLSISYVIDNVISDQIVPALTK